MNTIAQEASMLFEFRSTSQRCLNLMEEEMEKLIQESRKNCEIAVELLGVRPGNGDIDQEKLDAFTRRSIQIIQEYYDGELDLDAFSTDSNIPLSQGILANTIGTVVGAKSHTREEWVDLDSLSTGMKIVLRLMLYYTEA